MHHDRSRSFISMLKMNCKLQYTPAWIAGQQPCPKSPYAHRPSHTCTGHLITVQAMYAYGTKHPPQKSWSGTLCAYVTDQQQPGLPTLVDCNRTNDDQNNAAVRNATICNIVIPYMCIECTFREVFWGLQNQLAVGTTIENHSDLNYSNNIILSLTWKPPLKNPLHSQACSIRNVTLLYVH